MRLGPAFVKIGKAVLYTIGGTLKHGIRRTLCSAVRQSHRPSGTVTKSDRPYCGRFTVPNARPLQGAVPRWCGRPKQRLIASCATCMQILARPGRVGIHAAPEYARATSPPARTTAAVWREYARPTAKVRGVADFSCGRVRGRHSSCSRTRASEPDRTARQLGSMRPPCAPAWFRGGSFS